MAVVPVDGVQIPTSGVLSFGFQRSAKHRHQGVDLHAPLGTSVRAATGGVVRKVVRVPRRGFSGYGKCIVIEGGGVWCLYAHLGQVFVSRGEPVATGQIIGTVGRTCGTVEEPEKLCTRPHLHFEVSPRPYPQDSEARRIDPIAWLGDETWTHLSALVTVGAVALGAYLLRRIGLEQ